MQVRKSENIFAHEDEIKSRPKRTWFESEREKVLAKKKGQVELNGAGLKGKEGGKLSHKDKKRLDDGRERKEGKLWKKGKGDERDQRGRGREGVGRGRDGGGRGKGKDGGGRKGKGGKEGGGKAKKVRGGGGAGRGGRR